MRAANYVEETTTSIAGTSGDGAVTLSAITNTPRFSTVFGTGATQVRYVIEDTVNKKFEQGVGSVASNVLTRTKVLTTWDGTTYSDNAPSALQFGSSPTSGNIKVRISALAETQSPNLPGSNQSVGGDSWRDYPITASVGWDNNGSGASLTANREYYGVYELPISGRLQGVQYEVSSSAAGSLKVALFACNSNGFPGQKIVDFTTTSVSTTGAKTDTATGSWSPVGPIYLTPGWYYIGYISDVSPSLRGYGSGSSQGLKRRTPLGREGGYGWGSTCYLSGSYTTGLPSTPSTPTNLISGSSSNSVVWFGLKVTP